MGPGAERLGESRRSSSPEGRLSNLQEPEDVVPAWSRWTAVLLRPDALYGIRPADGGNKAAKLKAIRDALRTARRVRLAKLRTSPSRLVIQTTRRMPR